MLTTDQVAAIQASAARGAKLLDIHCKGWHKKIILKNLDLESTTCCILGQQFGDFWDGLEQLSLKVITSLNMVFDMDHPPRLDPSHYGFASMVGPNHPFDTSDKYSVLTEAWLYEIRCRRPR